MRKFGLFFFKFCFTLVIAFWANVAAAQVSTLSAWTNFYHGANDTISSSLSFATGSGTYRVLVVAIATEQSAVAARTVTVTYGGQALTSANGDLGTATIRSHTALYYLNEAGIEAATSTTLSITIAGGTTRVNDIWTGVYDYVNQTSPIGSSRNFNNANSAGTACAFASGLSVTYDDQAIEVISALRSGNTSSFTIGASANWTSTNEQTYSATDGIRNGVFTRSIPTVTATDVSSHSQSASTLTSMTGISLNKTTKQYRSNATGNWGTLASWQQSLDGGINWVNATTIPANTDGLVSILNGHTITLSAASTASSIDINLGGTLNTSATSANRLSVSGSTTISGTLTIANTGTHTFTGDVQLNANATWNESAAAIINIGSNFTIYSTSFTAGTGNHNFSGSTKTLSCPMGISIPSIIFTGAYTISGTLTSATQITVTGVTLTNNGTLTATTALSGTGGLTQGSSAVLNIGGSSGISTITATASGNSVNYTGGAQGVKATTYDVLIISGTGSKTTSSSVIVNTLLSMEGTSSITIAPTFGTSAALHYNTATARSAGVEWLNTFTSTGGITIESTGTITFNTSKVFGLSVPLTISSGASLATGGLSLSLGGNYYNNGGTLSAGSSAITITNTATAQSIAGFTTTGSLTMSKTAGTATFTGNVSAGNLIINGTGGTLDLGDSLNHTFSGTVTLTAGTLNGGSSTLHENATSAAAWSGNGSMFVASTGTVEFGGAGQTISATTATTFNNLTFSGSGNKAMGITNTVNGNLNVSGTAAVSPGAGLTISGDLTIGDGSGFSAGAYSLTVNGNTTVGAGTSGTFSITSTTGTKSFSGDVTINSGATWNNNTVNEVLTLGGNLTVNGTMNAGSGVHTFSGSSKSFNGTISIPSITVNGTYTNNGTLTVSTALIGTGELTQAVNTILNVGGTFSVSTFTATGTSNLVNFNGAAQLVRANSYFNITFSGSNTKTFQGTCNILGTISIASGVVANLNGFNSSAQQLQLNGAGQNPGTYGGTGSGASNINTTYFAAANGRLTISSCQGFWTGTTSTDWNDATNWCGNAIPSSSTDVIIPNVTNKPVIGSAGGQCRSITINTSSSLTITGTNTLTVGGNWTNNGTFTANNSTVNFNGSAQTIGGSAAATFYNLTLSGSGLKTRTTNPTVNGILSMEGSATISAAPTYGASATLQYNSPGARTAGVEWVTPFTSTGGVIIANAGTVTANGAKVFNSSVALTVSSNSNLDMSAYQFTLSGNLVNNGGTISGSGGVVLTGTATQSIGSFSNTANVSMTKTGGTATFTGNVSGSGLTLNGTGGTLNLGNGLTHTFSGDLTRTAGTLNGGSSTLRIAGSNSGTVATFTSGTGTVEWNGNGTQTIAAVSYYNLTISGSSLASSTSTFSVGGTTKITSGGTLILGASNMITGTNATQFDGGTYQTGSDAGYAETVGTLLLTDNSTLYLGTGSHALSFSASNLINWTSGKMLTITKWAGTSGTSGTSGKVYFGTTTSGLTPTQLAQIQFLIGSKYYSAAILSTGEIVPSCGTYALSSVTTSTACNSTYSTITITAPAANLPAATYRVTYNLSGANIATGVYGAMVVSTAGTGSFITQALTNSGITAITITQLFTGFCASTISTNNTANITLRSLTATISSTPVEYYCSINGTATVTASGGSGDYSYLWTPDGQTTATISNLYPENYSVLVTDNTYGCTASFATRVTTAYDNVCSARDGSLTYSNGSYLNTYFPGTTVTAGSNSITLGTARGAANTFASGDLALIIQMQGSDMVSTNTNDYGQVSNVIAGNYEYAYVSSFSGSILTLSSNLVNSYTNDLANRKTFQVIRVPQYNNLILVSNIIAIDWNGQTGGVVVIDVAKTLTMNGFTISADGKGFRGGACINSMFAGGTVPIINNYVFSSSVLGHGTKGEGIAGTPDNLYYNGAVISNTNCLYPTGQKGLGAAGNAGGGGNDPATILDNGDNAGGGGGSNLTTGGMGGMSWQSNLATGGNGGYALSGSTTKIFMGGGGGSGTANNNYLGHGGTGGGIIIVHAGSIANAGIFSANGNNGVQIYNSAGGNDGGGGGGAGGSIIVTASSGLNLINESVKGGAGSNAWEVSEPGTPFPGNHHGPGGGGGGGVVYRTYSTSTANVMPGLNGTSCDDLDPYGANQGSPGVITAISESDLSTTILGRNCKIDFDAPVITEPSDISVCTGDVPAAISTMAGFNASDSASGVTGPPACIKYTETGSESSGTIWRTYTIYDNAGNFDTTTQVITVKQRPTVTSATTGVICSGIAQNYFITSNMLGTTYSWNRPLVTGISNLAVTNQTANPVTEKLINTSNAAVNAIYSITPTNNGCTGSVFNYNLTVNPSPSNNRLMHY